MQLRIQQWQVEDGVRSEYQLVEVVNHRSASQLPLFDGAEQKIVV